MINIAIVKTARCISTRLGVMLDAEDREFLGRALILMGSFVFIVLIVAGSLGLAVRLFGIAAG